MSASRLHDVVPGGTAFEAIAADLDYPVFVVTAASEGSAAGCLVGFTTQCSIEPVRMLVCLSKNNATWEVAQTSRSLGVHLVRPEQRELAEHFGGTSAKDDPSKLGSWPWSAGPDGVPVLADCDGFVGRVLQQFDLGDHTGFLLDPTSGELARDGTGQLGFGEAEDIDAGQPAGES